MYFQGIRGAITITNDTPDEVLNKTTVLLNTILEKNHLSYQDIISIIFTSTHDISSQYPAVAARNMGMVEIPLLCCQEMYVEGSLEKCIRVLIYIQGMKRREVQHIYLEKAANLRPDLISKEVQGGFNEESSNDCN